MTLEIIDVFLKQIVLLTAILKSTLQMNTKDASVASFNLSESRPDGEVLLQIDVTSLEIRALAPLLKLQ